MSIANTNDSSMLEINWVNLVILIVIIYSIFPNKIKKNKLTLLHINKKVDYLIIILIVKK